MKIRLILFLVLFITFSAKAQEKLRYSEGESNFVEILANENGLYASFPIHYPSYAKYWIDVLNKTLKYGKVNNTAKVDIRRPIGAPVPITLEVSMKYYGGTVLLW